MDYSKTLGFLVTKLARAMSNELDNKLRAYGVTVAQWALLKQLWEQEGRSQVELQELLGLEGATVTGMIQRMMNQGLVSRCPDPNDKRMQRVYLTQRGRALEQQVTVPVEEALERALIGFTADERDFFIRLLSRALHNFDK